ncbi:MAG: hypothetical protein ACLFTT_14145 [Candidatus Hydrogenedentota bacterium]
MERVGIAVFIIVLFLAFFAIDWGVDDIAAEGCSRDVAPPVADFWAGDGVTDVTFIAFGDPQCGGGSPDKNQLHVRAINAAADVLRWMEAPFGFEAAVANIRGVIIAGDMTHNARDGRPFEVDDYQDFIDCYGLCGNRMLKYPVYEGYGNHDFYVWNNPLFRLYDAHPPANAVARRNVYRPGVLNTAPGDDGHYSWDWDNVHFVQLNLKPSDVPGEAYGDREKPVPGALDPRNALTFLEQDLAAHVAGTDKRVVIIAHYGFHENRDFDGWWTPAEAEAFYEVIQGYPVIAYLHGHNHGTQFYRWRDIPVLDLGSPYYRDYNRDGRGHFTVVRITDDYLYAGDAAWNPDNPEGDIIFPAGWHVKAALQP